MVGLLVPFHGPSNAFFKGNGTLVAQQIACLVRQSTRKRDIAGLVWKDLNVGLFTHMLLHQANKVLQGSSTAFAKIENLVRIGSVNGSDHTVDNVVNVGVVTTTGPISKLLEFGSTTDTVNELEGGHVGSSTRSVDCEKAQPSNIEARQVVVGISQEFAGLFRSGVG